MKTHMEIVDLGGPSVPALLCVCLAALLLDAGPAAGEQRESERHPATPGVLYVEGLDEDSTRLPVTDEGTGARSWTWAWGALTVFADSMAVTAGAQGLNLSYDTDLVGVSRGRRLRFVYGKYPVDGPLLLGDRRFQLYVSRGQLEIAEGRLVLDDRKKPPKPAAQYLLFLGVLLVTMFMMMKTRARLKKS